LAFLAFRPRFAVFFGTFAPAALASERPIAIACFRLLTFCPERPLFNVPALRFFIARSTVLDAFFEYFRAMIVLPLAWNQSARKEIVPPLADPKVNARFADVGFEPMPMTPSEFGKFVADESEKWGKVVRAANIKPE
jgi:hypothetical protein